MQLLHPVQVRMQLLQETQTGHLYLNVCLVFQEVGLLIDLSIRCYLFKYLEEIIAGSTPSNLKSFSGIASRLLEVCKRLYSGVDGVAVSRELLSKFLENIVSLVRSVIADSRLFRSIVITGTTNLSSVSNDIVSSASAVEFFGKPFQEFRSELLRSCIDSRTYYSQSSLLFGGHIGLFPICKYQL